MLTTRTRGLLAVGLAAALLSCAAPPAAAHSPAYYAWEQEGVHKFVWNGGKLYAEGQCDIGGAVAASFFIWVAGSAAPVYAIGSAIAGGSFTYGCSIGAPDNPGRMVGVPYSKNCWRVYPDFKWSRRTTECMA